MKIKTLSLHFTCDEPIKERSDKLRGYFAERFGDFILIHHHLNGELLLYKMPLIQYKILEAKPFVLGINEGTELLQKIYQEIEYLKIGDREYQIMEKKIVFRTESFGLTEDTDNFFTFLTPWLALNEDNYGKYQKFGTWAEKKGLLEKILIGNIISMSKSLGYTVPKPITANIYHLKEVQTRLKDNSMRGFLGKFAVNFEIPDYFGIGKSVSRGFGTIKKIGKIQER